MDDFEVTGSGQKDKGQDEPIQLDDTASGGGGISHSPLNLGGGGSSGGGSSGSNASVKPAEKAASTAGEVVSWPDRITGVRTFFTKLHAGAIEFLDEQITNWLRNNPGIMIKRTNTVTGNLVGKKVEPNIIITVWY